MYFYELQRILTVEMPNLVGEVERERNKIDKF